MSQETLAPSVTHKDDKGRKFVSIVEAAYDKAKLSEEEAQRVNDTPGLAKLVSDFIASSRLDISDDRIIRRVAVDRSLTPQQAIEATGRKKYLTNDVVATMPQGKGSEVELIFIKSNRYRTDPEVDAFLAEHGLVSADPHVLAAFNAADPAFADTHPNSTHWKDAKGKWCYAAFDRWRGVRDVDVDRNDDKWSDYWWFAGVRK